MKTNKEYPATHSMSTQWFAVDIDGNVAVIDFDDNGPIPDVVPSEESVDEVIMSYLSLDEADKQIQHINYSPQQVDAIISGLMPVTNAEDLCVFDAIFKIDKDQLGTFLSIIDSNKNIEYRNVYCLSEELSIYVATLYDLSQKALGKLINDKIIVSQMPYGSWIGDDMDDNEMRTFPFFIYKQPYNTDSLISRLSTPEHPVRISQYPEKFGKLAIKLPFSFSEKESFQIAEYYNSIPYAGRIVRYNSRLYHWLPNEAGTNSYYLESIVPEWYGGTMSFQCSRCFKNTAYKHSGQVYPSHCYCDLPTVMIISDVYPQSGSIRYKFPKDSVLYWNAFDVCILQCIPSIKPHVWEDEIEGMYPETELIKIFANCKGFIEQCVSELKPYALVVFPQAMRLLSTQYNISDNKIDISGYILPIYAYDEVEENYAEIKRLASQTYRGIILPRILEPDNLPEGAEVYD